jgi:alkaline phosphatase
MRILILIPILLLLACQPSNQNVKTEERAKNVILLIGDGMGLSQITAGLYANGNQLFLEEFKHLGLHKSYSADDLITDSAAGGTALSIGKKTYNGAIGVDVDTLSHQTILEKAEEKGLATGLIATSTITHATPAAFIAHQPSRKMYEEIAADFLKTEIDFFVGGGIAHFTDRQDGKNLLDSLANNGYLVSDSTRQNLKEIEPDPSLNFAYLTSMSSPLKYSEGRDYLEPATKMGLEFLNQHSDKGFFLMVEGSQIDWGGHANDQRYIIDEMLEFDRVVKEVLDFAKKDGETLVVVTADHETGGMSINKGSSLDTLICKFTSGSHTADLIPVFAYGPGAENFGGIYENTAIYDKMLEAYGWAE